MKLKRETIFIFIIAFLWLCFYFIVKCLHFQKCHYDSDIISHFQMSRDWMLGKPFLYENQYGYHGKIHNYFLDVFMGPFTYLFSVYGLFIVLFVLLAVALFSVLKHMDEAGQSFNAKAIFVILFSSPLTYFILHNETYGFHAELLLMPFCLMLTVSCLRRSKWYLLWAILVILTKEDAVILLWCCLSAVYFAQWDQQSISGKVFLKKITGASVICALIFGAGMAWLKYQNNWGSSRSDNLVEILSRQSASDLCSSLSILTLERIQLTALVILIVYLYAGWKFTLGAILLSIPVLILNFFSGMLYFNEGEFWVKNGFSLLWAPRLAMYWGYWLCAVLLALAYRQSVSRYAPYISITACVLYGVLVFQFQVWFFQKSEVAHLNIPWNIKGVFYKNDEFEIYPEFTDAVAIARILPPHYVVAPIYRVFDAFHKQDIAWKHNWKNSYYPIRMVLTQYDSVEATDIREILKHPVHMVYKGRLDIYTEIEDTSYISKAGLYGEWRDLTITMPAQK